MLDSVSVHSIVREAHTAGLPGFGLILTLAMGITKCPIDIYSVGFCPRPVQAGFKQSRKKTRGVTASAKLAIGVSREHVNPKQIAVYQLCLH